MKTSVAFAVSLAFLVSAAGAAEKAVTLNVGDKAPDFEIVKPGQVKAGDPGLKLSDLLGKKNVLLAFYPKAFTPVCSSQMCGYRDDFAKFQGAGTEVVAVSLDKQADSDTFKKEKELPFYVVGDPDGKIVSAYGVPLVDLPAGHLAKRSVFLIDKTGVIQYVDPAYDIEKGKQPLLDAVAKRVK